MSTAFKTSQSKVEAWRQCRQKYHWKYSERLAKRRIRRPFAFGRIIHEMKEEKANGGDPFEHLAELNKKHGHMFKEEVEEYGDIMTDTRLVMVDYYDYYKTKPLTILRRKGQAAEHAFELEVDKGALLIKGKIDQFAQTPNKLTWIVEHKNVKDIPDEDARWRNLQSMVYNRVNDMLGWFKVEGLLWDYIRSKSPSRPRILKSGLPSKAALDTLPSVVVDFYTNTLKKPAKDIPKFMIEAAERNRPHFFQRIFTPTKKKLVDLVWNEFIETSREMSEKHGKSKTKTIGRHCSWCDYEPLCRAELRGLDVDYLKESEYYEEPSDYSDWEAPLKPGGRHGKTKVANAKASTGTPATRRRS